ncbi:MAG TPA: sugar transferase [Hyphomicrobium sp.]|uniref:sugar transferase n=1 Tax=Hyphomicrobium sp. TaxID=82 RepID=UPI002CC995F9|nr:sugar transferase [Hyphomicrobium sp.]HRN87719.1 sugar transferase [Hyphomicrobium sp.]
MPQAAIKRAFDIVTSAAALVVLAVPMLALALAVRLRLGSPVVFRQPRPGLHGQLFTLLKFRTMTDERDAAGQLLPDADRLTSFGRWLRATSLDELPELINILKGEMSIVGPRPLLPEYLPLYTPEQARRHDVRPGLTGWAQINGRNALTWEDKFALDVWYVDNQSLRLDLRILAATVMTVLRRDGITAEHSATVDRFRGS